MIVGEDSLIVLEDYVFRNSFHAEDLDVKTRSIGECVVNGREVFLVNLTHVNAETSCGVQPSTASFAFEVFGLLMADENLEIIEIAFAVVAPWSRKDLFDIGVVALFLGHLVGHSRWTGGWFEQKQLKGWLRA